MNKVNDGGPAFPMTVQRWNDSLDGSRAGMSLRDAAALAALPAVIAATSAGQHTPTKRSSDEPIRHAIARDAFAMADAFIAARTLSEGE